MRDHIAPLIRRGGFSKTKRKAELIAHRPKHPPHPQRACLVVGANANQAHRGGGRSHMVCARLEIGGHGLQSHRILP